MSYKPFCTFSVPIDYLCLVNYIFFSIPQKNSYSFRSHHSPLNHRGFLILGEPTSTGKIGFYGFYAVNMDPEYAGIVLCD